MAMGDKIQHAAQEAGGKVKEAAGKATGNMTWKPKATATRLRRTSSGPATRRRTQPTTSSTADQTSAHRPARYLRVPRRHQSRFPSLSRVVAVMPC